MNFHPDGDTGISLMFFVPTPERATFIAEAHEAEGVDAFVPYGPDDADYHGYADWSPILGQRTWSANGGPWRWHEGKFDYSPEMCPRTLDLRGRAVHLDVSPNLSEQNVGENVEAVNKVLTAAL